MQVNEAIKANFNELNSALETNCYLTSNLAPGEDKQNDEKSWKSAIAVIKNLQTLLTAPPQQGQKQYFLDSNGELQPVRTFWQRNFRYNQTRVAGAIEDVVNAVSNFQFKGVDQKKEFFKTLFFDNMSRLSRDVFDRAWIAKNTEMHEYMRTIVEQDDKGEDEVILNEEAEKKRAAAGGSDEQEDYAKRWTEFKLARRCGIDIELNPEGSSGVYKAHGVGGDILFSIKPAEEGPHEVDNPKAKSLSKCIRKRLRSYERDSIKGHPAYRSEVWASKIDQHAKLNIVPLSKTVRINSPAFNGAKVKEASCQIWIRIDDNERQQFASSITKSRFFGSTYMFSRQRFPETDKFKVEFDKLVINDFVSGNQDRDTDNWLIKFIKSVGNIVDIVIKAFDNGLAFPEKHPNSWKSTRKQYMWGKLRCANRAFTLEGKSFINTFTNAESLKALFDSFGPNFSKEQKETMIDRIVVLEFASRYDGTLSELSGVKRPADFQHFFAHKADKFSKDLKADLLAIV